MRQKKDGSEMNKPHEERFPPRLWLSDIENSHAVLMIQQYPDEQEYLSLTEHQHILAEKEKRIERLQKAHALLDKIFKSGIGIDGSPLFTALPLKEMKALLTEIEDKAALQEETK